MPSINDKIDDLLERVTRIDTLLFPDGPYQPSLLTEYKHRIKSLESWRYYLTGAWAVIVGAYFAIRGLRGH